MHKNKSNTIVFEHVFATFLSIKIFEVGFENTRWLNIAIKLHSKLLRIILMQSLTIYLEKNLPLLASLFHS